MLKIIVAEGDYLEYEVGGKLHREELLAYYRCLDERFRKAGPLRVFVRVTAFRGYAGPAAWWLFLTREHKVLRKVRRYAAVADEAWFRLLLRGVNRVVPSIRIRGFTRQEISAARAWLQP